jgi:SAM-dependent methyltransferase
MGREDATYREALGLLCDDPEGTYFLYRFSDPTHVTVEALVRALAQREWPVRGRILDLCGGTGHLTRVLTSLRPAGDTPEPGTVLADSYFWKLWLARRFIAPDAAPVCCDANQPLPFARDTFSTVLLADAFPYIWHKRLLAEEMMRLAGEDGVVVMPHLHSALGENFSAGDTLTPSAYRGLFAPQGPRLFSDRRLFDDVIERRLVDLTRDVSPEQLGAEPSLTLVASRRANLFRRYEVPEDRSVTGQLTVNPLYRVERSGASSILTLGFPTPEYEEEFGACRRYMPDHVTVEADLTVPILPEALGSRYAELRDRRVLIDAPEAYW